MKPIDLSILLFSTIYIVSMIILVLLGENRPDVYMSIGILVYFIYISLDTRIRENTNMKYVNILLFTVFMVIVAYRVLTILGIRVI
ncbi:MAG: hypothetical protein J7J82_03695 [Staphylothermus sp.]|nr:hypothetical protein [Staphylothermus sp.]